MSDDPLVAGLDRWLADAGFVDVSGEQGPGGAAGTDDPWGEVDLGDIGLTEAQRDSLRAGDD